MDSQQILLRGANSFVAAPMGQLVEGYLAIAPYACVGAVALLDEPATAEVEHFRSLIADFYDEAYGVTEPIFYEQGRGGGGDRVDRAHRFPFHAHLCGLPLAVDAHSELRPRFAAKPISALHELRSAAAGEPYVYVDGVGHAGELERIVYLPTTRADAEQLVRLRLKRELAGLLGIGERADWRDYPGHLELAHLIGKFDSFCRERGVRHERSVGRR